MAANILVVDDNQANLDLMVYLLRAFGHTVTPASDGLSGFETARTGEFDLVLTDILMPGIDGYEFAKRFRADSHLRERRLLGVTALAMVGDRERVLAAGFDGYLSKPIDPQEFVGFVDSFLPAALRSSSPAHHSGVAASLREQTATGQTVLVVDDVPSNIDVLRGALEPFGYRVLEAHDAHEAIGQCGREKPDLILCDLHMPTGDGFALMTLLKADPQLREIPVLFMSSTSGNTADKLRALELGAIKFLIRPIDPRHLLTEVKEALRR